MFIRPAVIFICSSLDALHLSLGTVPQAVPHTESRAILSCLPSDTSWLIPAQPVLYNGTMLMQVPSDLQGWDFSSAAIHVGEGCVAFVLHVVGQELKSLTCLALVVHFSLTITCLLPGLDLFPRDIFHHHHHSMSLCCSALLLTMPAGIESAGIVCLCFIRHVALAVGRCSHCLAILRSLFPEVTSPCCSGLSIACLHNVSIFSGYLLFFFFFL